jgi:hypothetical protein
MVKTPLNAISFRPSQELEDTIRALAESKGKSLSDTIVDLLESATCGEDSNQYQWLEKECPALIHDKGVFSCFIRSPIDHKLGDGTNESAKIRCKACQEIKGIMDKAKLNEKFEKAGYPFDVPYCMGKGIVREDLKTVYCPKVGFDRPITICETAGPNRRRCEYFKLIRVYSKLGDL